MQGFSAAFGRFERIALGDRSLLVLLIKNPAGANEVVRTLVAAGAPSLLLIALNDEIADGRDVSWIWDVDWEPLLAGLDRVVVTGERAAEMALRCKYAGFPPEAIEVVPELDRALDRGLELTAEGGDGFCSAPVVVDEDVADENRDAREHPTSLVVGRQVTGQIGYGRRPRRVGLLHG